MGNMPEPKSPEKAAVRPWESRGLKSFQAWIRPELHKRIKIAAAQRELTIGEMGGILIEAGLQAGDRRKPK